eukprot:6489141-Amphidinium_carterae.1
MRPPHRSRWRRLAWGSATEVAKPDTSTGSRPRATLPVLPLARLSQSDTSKTFGAKGEGWLIFDNKELSRTPENAHNTPPVELASGQHTKGCRVVWARCPYLPDHPKLMQSNSLA